MSQTKVSKYQDAVRHINIVVEEVLGFVSVYDATEENVITATAIEKMQEQGLELNSISIEPQGRHKGKVCALFTVKDYREDYR